ncbi:hypothetical protein MVEN_00034500 [Mycena venus]|uniref:Uncharacterized protein n=1 Tax=Mycena venus TaxID=2733690 RepID=A0A8H6Z718_9AGAR|nr:hypothetical protein MVEN_00034500 [Mycena venus]
MSYLHIGAICSNELVYFMLLVASLIGMLGALSDNRGQVQRFNNILKFHLLASICLGIFLLFVTFHIPGISQRPIQVATVALLLIMWAIEILGLLIIKQFLSLGILRISGWWDTVELSSN